MEPRLVKRAQYVEADDVARPPSQIDCSGDRLDALGDRAQVVIATIAFDLACVRVDREHLATALAQAPVDDVAPAALRLSRDAGHGYPLVGQELRCGLDRWHRNLPSLEAFTAAPNDCARQTRWCGEE
jgi:hypothetical protein